MRAAHWPNWVPQLWPPQQPSSPPSGQATPVQGTQLPKSRPQPSQDMRPSPDQLQALPLPLEPPLLAPGDRAGCPSLTTVCNSSVCQHSRLSFQPLDTNSRTRNLSRGEKCTSILTCSLHETSTTRVESHHCPLPHNPDTSRGDTSRPAAMQVHRQRDTLSQVVTHISLL